MNKLEYLECFINDEDFIGIDKNRLKAVIGSENKKITEGLSQLFNKIDIYSHFGKEKEGEDKTVT